ncbi:MAG: ATP synthase F1 subunit gamma [Planctomycetota bacterium]|nr:MAG: ATP synthase F1 subunit gamma [Planctomycetota bacterium]
MAKTRELLRRRKGVSNTKKITGTMELIATAKLKKLINRIIDSKPYAKELSGLVQDLLKSGLELDLARIYHPSNKVLVLSIASNRGLCGAYNVRIVDETRKFIQSQKEQGKNVELHVIGKRAISMFAYSNTTISREYRDLDDRAGFYDIQKLAREYMDLFLHGEIHEFYVIYTAFHSRSRQDLEVVKLLPLSKPEGEEEKSESSPFLFEPSPQAVLGQLAPLAVEMNLFQMFMEAITSEQAYRMRAMKNATENAETMIKDLTRMYNRARQTQITLELLDIIGGASAL